MRRGGQAGGTVMKDVRRYESLADRGEEGREPSRSRTDEDAATETSPITSASRRVLAALACGTFFGCSSLFAPRLPSMSGEGPSPNPCPSAWRRAGARSRCSTLPRRPTCCSAPRVLSDHCAAAAHRAFAVRGKRARVATRQRDQRCRARPSVFARVRMTRVCCASTGAASTPSILSRFRSVEPPV